MPPELVTWFVDENNLFLARRLAERVENVVYPGHSDLPEIPRRTPDDQWLPIVGQKRMIVLTRDARIRYRPVEKARWLEHGVRGFVLTAAGNMRIDDQLSLLGDHWPAMTRWIDHNPDGPWMLAVTRSEIRALLPEATAG